MTDSKVEGGAMTKAKKRRPTKPSRHPDPERSEGEGTTAKVKNHQPAEVVKEKINWGSVERQVRMLSRAGDEGVRLRAEPEQILAEAQRLARIYQKAGKPLPDTLAALI